MAPACSVEKVLEFSKSASECSSHLNVEFLLRTYRKGGGKKQKPGADFVSPANQPSGTVLWGPEARWGHVGTAEGYHGGRSSP